MGATLITGGAGFIGSHFVNCLYRNRPSEEIIVLDALTYAGNIDNIPLDIREDKKRFQFVNGSINDRWLVGSLMDKVDKVVHFAAESHVTRSIVDEAIFFETNVLGTHVIASSVAARRSKISRFIHISTSEVYGTHSTSSSDMSESHPLLPRSPYAASKAAADRLVYSYQATYDIPLVIIRPFNNYGPRQYIEKVIPRFITSALTSRPLEVHGSGLMTRDWIYVEDTCEAVLRALDRHIDWSAIKLGKASEFVINVGTGTDRSVLHIAKLISDVMDAPPVIKHIPDRPGQVDRHIASTTRAQQLLGFQAKTSLLTGIAKTVGWYREHRDLWTPYLDSAAIDITDRQRGLAGNF